MKRETRLFEWLETKKVWVKPAILLSSNHVKVGWLLRSYHTYKHYARATEDILMQIETKGVELELSHHTISHTTTTGEIIKIHALKVVITADNCNDILEGLINALTDTPTKYTN